MSIPKSYAKKVDYDIFFFLGEIGSVDRSIYVRKVHSVVFKGIGIRMSLKLAQLQVC
jgi:hypothetical protein